MLTTEQSEQIEELKKKSVEIRKEFSEISKQITELQEKHRGLYFEYKDCITDMGMIYFENWSVEEAKPGDILTAAPLPGSEKNPLIFIYNGTSSRDYVDGPVVDYFVMVEFVTGMLDVPEEGSYIGKVSDGYIRPSLEVEKEFLLRIMKQKGMRFDFENNILIDLDNE